FLVSIKHIGEWNRQQLDPEVFSKLFRILHTPTRREFRWHQHANDVLASKCINSDACCQRGIDAAAQSKHDLFESILVTVIACADNKGAIILRIFRQGSGERRTGNSVRRPFSRSETEDLSGA